MNRDIPTIIRDLNQIQESLEQVKLDLPNTYAGSAQWERLHTMRLEVMKELGDMFPLSGGDDGGTCKLRQIESGLPPCKSCGNRSMVKTVFHRDGDTGEWDDWNSSWGFHEKEFEPGHVERGARCEVCKAKYIVEGKNVS